MLSVDTISEAFRSEYFIEKNTYIRIESPVAMNEDRTISFEHALHFLKSRTIPFNGFFWSAEVVVVVVKDFAGVVENVTVNEIY